MTLIDANISQRDTTICKNSSITLNIDSLKFKNVKSVSGFYGPYMIKNSAYYFSKSSSSWTNARASSISLGGHLAIFEDIEENREVAKISNTLLNFKTASASWFGITDEVKEGVWLDVRGNTPKYTWWANINPSNDNGREHYGMFYTVPEGGDGLGSWNDLPDAAGLLPFVVEIENAYQITWSNGDNANAITVFPTQTTKYYVTVSNGIISCKDSVTVTVSDIGSVNPLQDTIRVCGDSATLDAGAGFAQYKWSNGATTQKIVVKSGGKYSVAVTNAAGCSASDSSLVSIVKAKIIQRDTTICKGASITLSIDSTISGSTACNSSQLPANLQNGLVAYYPFCGNANDESGNGYNGMISGATLSLDRFNKSNSAFYFNGINSKIELPLLSSVADKSSISISIFAKPLSGGVLWGQWSPIPMTGPVGLVIGITADGRVATNLLHGEDIFTTNAFSFDQWHNYTFVFDGNNPIPQKRVSCYVDGVKQEISFTRNHQPPTRIGSQATNVYFGERSGVGIF